MILILAHIAAEPHQSDVQFTSPIASPGDDEIEQVAAQAVEMAAAMRPPSLIAEQLLDGRPWEELATIAAIVAFDIGQKIRTSRTSS